MAERSPSGTVTSLREHEQDRHRQGRQACPRLALARPARDGDAIMRRRATGVAHLYRTRNLTTGRIYVGVSRGRDNPKYLGSGTVIQRAIAKHGPEHFRRRVLCIGSPQYVLWLESQIVDDAFVARRDTYNVARGGGMPPGRTGPHSEETKAKIAVANTGKRHSPETRAKISRVQKGVPKAPRTPEHCRNLSLARRGVKLSPEHCKAIGRARRGRKMGPRSEATKAKLAKAMTGRKVSPETRAKISKTLTGRKNGPQSAETRAKISKALSGRKGVSPSKETREKLRLANLGRKRSPETRQRMSEARRAWWARKRKAEAVR